MISKAQCKEAAQEAPILLRFMSTQQYKTLLDGLRGEEGEFFYEKIMEIVSTFHTMPKSYETDGQGDSAIVRLHYFIGGMDWYITERDMEEEQLQAFGLANLGHGGELGYISLLELAVNKVELDLHWEPKTVAECKKM